MFERILVAVDGSETARWAVESAGRLAHALRARMGLVHVIDVTKGFSPGFEFVPVTLIAKQEEAAGKLLAELQRRLPPGVSSERIMCTGDPATEIIAAAARWRARLIVVGTHARGRLAKLLLGSVAEAVIRGAHCPVMTVGTEPPPEALSRLADEPAFAQEVGR